MLWSVGTGCTPKVTVLYCTVRLYAMLAPSGFRCGRSARHIGTARLTRGVMSGAQRLAAEIEVLRAALAESEATIAMLLELQAETLSENEDDFPVTQGMPAAMPRPLTPPAADDDEPEMTQGEPSAPRRVLACSPRTRLPSVMRIAFVGIRDGPELQRLKAMVTQLGGLLEPPNTLSAAVTHVVCVPSVGARRSAMSIFAALSKKILVTPRWIEASAQGGAFVPLAAAAPGLESPARCGGNSCDAEITNGKRRDADEGTERYWQNQARDQPKASSASAHGCSFSEGESSGGGSYIRRGDNSDSITAKNLRDGDNDGALHAVAGIANPLDAQKVHLTEAFRRVHSGHKLVGPLLLAEGGMLLKRAAVVPVSRMASVIFVAHEDELDSREVSMGALVLTFEGFLERLVPGHNAGRLLQPTTGGSSGLRKRTRECATGMAP